MRATSNFCKKINFLLYLFIVNNFVLTYGSPPAYEPEKQGRRGEGVERERERERGGGGGGGERGGEERERERYMY